MGGQDSPDGEPPFLGRLPNGVLMLLAALGVGALGLVTGIWSRIGAALSPAIAAFLFTQWAAIGALPLGQQLGLGLIGFTLLSMLVALIPIGKAAQWLLQSRQTQNDMSAAIEHTIGPAITEIASGVQMLRDAQPQSSEQLEALTRGMSHVLDILEDPLGSGDGAAGRDDERYGPPYDMPQLEVPSHFIGQTQALDALRAALAANSTWRGVWVYGPAGIGKTSAVAKVVRACPPEWFPDGFVYVDCAKFPSSDAVLRKVIQRFDPQRKRPPVRSEVLPDLAQTRLKDKSALIVLDSVPLAPDYRRVIATLTTIPSGGSALRVVMITGHEPSMDHFADLARIPIDYLTPEDAEELFLLCYLGAPNGEVSADDRDAVATIVESLGYFPLAIAVYARQAQDLGRTLPAFAEELRQHPLHVGGDERVRKVYDDSLRNLETLQPDAAKLLIAWGAFGAPAIGRQALVAMASGMGMAQPEKLLRTLQRRLLAGPAETDAPLPRSDTERWQVHRLMFDYLTERFEAQASEARQLEQTLAARYFAQYVTTDMPARAISGDEAAITRAVIWSLDVRSVELDECAARLGLALARFWRSRWDNENSLKYLPGLIAAAERVAKRTRKRDDLLRLADLNMLRGRAFRHLGKLTLARRYYRADLRIRRRSKTRDVKGEAAACYYLGQLYRARGFLRRAEKLCARSLALAHQEQDKKLIGLALGELGRITRIRGNIPTAIGLFAQAFELLADAGEMLDAGVQLGYLGRIARLRGRPQEAQKYFEDSIRLARAAHDTRGEGIVLSHLGRIKRTQGKLTAAEDLFNQSLKIATYAADTTLVATVLGYLGRLEYTRCHLKHAEELFQQSYRLSRSMGDRQNVAMVLGYIGRIHRVRGQWIRALVTRMRGLIMVYRIGDRRGQLLSLRQIARFALQLRMLRLANGLASRAELALHRMQDQLGFTTARMLRGEIAAARGELAMARMTFTQCKAAFERLEDRDNVGLSLYWLARVAGAESELEAADTYYTEALALARTIGDCGLEAKCLYHWGRLLSRNRATDLQGKAYLREALGMYASMGAKPPPERVRSPRRRLSV